MSSISIAGDTSGSVILTVPAAAGSTTVTLAAQTGTLNAAGPAFSAYMSANQSPTVNAATKINFNTEDYDTNSNYDNTTYRFTPTVAGYYQVNLVVTLSAAGAGANGAAVIFKNGTAYKAAVVNNAVNYYSAATVSTIVSMNGTSDYLEAYINSASSAITVFSAITVASTALTASSFSACLIRGA